MKCLNKQIGTGSDSNRVNFLKNRLLNNLEVGFSLQNLHGRYRFPFRFNGCVRVVRATKPIRRR
jgi:hypothetical protein